MIELRWLGRPKLQKRVLQYREARPTFLVVGGAGTLRYYKCDVWKDVPFVSEDDIKDEEKGNEPIS